MADEDQKDQTAQELLLKFLKDNNMSFAIRKQKVRYMDDNGIVIDPPMVVVEFNKIIEKVNNG